MSNCEQLELTGETVLAGVQHSDGMWTYKARLQRPVDTSPEFIHDIQRAFLLRDPVEIVFKHVKSHREVQSCVQTTV